MKSYPDKLLLKSQRHVIIFLLEVLALKSFCMDLELHKTDLINYAKIVGSEVIIIYWKTFGVPQEFGWLAQLLWGAAADIRII